MTTRLIITLAFIIALCPESQAAGNTLGIAGKSTSDIHFVAAWTSCHEEARTHGVVSLHRGENGAADHVMKALAKGQAIPPVSFTAGRTSFSHEQGQAAGSSLEKRSKKEEEC